MSTTETENFGGLKRSNYQATVDGKKTDLFFLKNSKGHVVAITNYGGAVVGVFVPDKNGELANVIQSYDSIEAAQKSDSPYKSTLIGRYGNRICEGNFTLNGKAYHLL